MIHFNLVTERVDKGETVTFLVPQKGQNDPFQLGYRERQRVDKGETVTFLVPQKDQNDPFQLGYRES